MKQIQKNTH